MIYWLWIDKRPKHTMLYTHVTSPQIQSPLLTPPAPLPLPATPSRLLPPPTSDKLEDIFPYSWPKKCLL